MTKILITGGSGFIGSNLLSQLPNDIVSLLGRTIPDSFKGGSARKLIDSQENYEDCLKGIDVVIHLAAVAHDISDDQKYMEEVNVGGTLNLAKQAVDQNVKRFIFISSIGVLGNKTNSPLTENSVSAPHSKYAESKLKAENALLKLAKETSLEVVIIRPVLVYGKGAPGNFSKLMSIVKITSFLPFGLTKNKRSFISIHNLVEFIKACILHTKAKNEIFNITDSSTVSIKEFTNAIAIGLSTKIIQLPVPVFLFKILGRLMKREDQVGQLVGDLEVDITKAKNLLNWKPSETMSQAMSKLS
jgi:nucleoside-diphosphate-sugar epimerase